MRKATLRAGWGPTDPARAASPGHGRGAGPPSEAVAHRLQVCRAKALIWRPSGKAQGVGHARAPAGRLPCCASSLPLPQALSSRTNFLLG